MSDGKATLYLVPTPIGNMGDISDRVRATLSEVEVIACEDTRHSGRLLQQLGIKKKLLSYHNFNETQRASQLIEILRHGSSVAVITDAGSPGISDPAFRVVRIAIEHDIEIIPIPGPNAIIPALTASGLPTDRFFFEGFLSPKSGARKKRLSTLKELNHTLIFYESPHRIVKTIADMLIVLGNRQACIAREISKVHEEFLRGTLKELNDCLSKRKLKGEMVVLVGGSSMIAEEQQET